ncbi:hypothetical protein MRQ36_22795 [Micromonospora sp. R77]|nr:hypothetical protein [Micromonospora sp. R77]MCI4065238.1 hypothetical protein [Micromonospora sp. R77]
MSALWAGQHNVTDTSGGAGRDGGHASQVLADGFGWAAPTLVSPGVQA